VKPRGRTFSSKPAGACIVAVLFSLLAACAQLETRAPGNVEFDLSGRIAARHANESFSGNLAWRHAAEHDELLLSTPLGQGVARIVRDGNSVTLTTAEPREYKAADAESLTEQALGFRLPLAGLADWVRARPSPESPAKVEKSADGRVQVLEQQGWKIEYQEYAGERPSRMRLLYPGIELRLVISNWN
jgi:outer membrane lipoprotein LolB